MPSYDSLTNFGRAVYTVGDGSPHGNDSKTDVNKLSRGNVHVAADLLTRDRDAFLFIAGGNDGINGARNRDGVEGSLQEADRMKLYLRDQYGLSAADMERVYTDCDPAFTEHFGLSPSGNTPQNARNAAEVIYASGVRTVQVTAEIIHFARVMGTLRKQLDRLGILKDLDRIEGYPVISDFEERTNQIHIQDRKRFQRRDLLVKVHHILMGEVPRFEFTVEWAKARMRALFGKEDSIKDAQGTYTPDLLYRGLVVSVEDSRKLDTAEQS